MTERSPSPPSPTDEASFDIDPSWVRIAPTTLLAGSPLTLFRVTAAGVRVLDALTAGTALPAGHQALTRRLLAAGAVHPRPVGGTFGVRDVTVVVPAYDDDANTIQRSLVGVGEVGGRIVVDDGSARPIGEVQGARSIRLGRNRGPAAARNAALDDVATSLVLFMDADASLDPGELELLVTHFDDERVGAVAPRILPPPVGAGHEGTLARYEAVRSPLDMGDARALVRAGTRVSYVPSAVLLCRVDALRDVAGFDESLRYGEDVDLVWRLADAGWACRYEPSAIARHAIRTSLQGWLLQRYRYGTAAAALERRHPGALAPVRVNRWSLGGWSAAAIGHPIVGLGLGMGSSITLARKLSAPGSPPRWRDAWGVAGRGNLHAGRQLADAVTGVWWPVAALAALVSKRARRMLAVVTLVPAVAEWVVRRPRLDPVRFTALRMLDRGAYGLGVWRGVAAHREVGPLRPAVT
jgi:mycofactocin system glycosyltransferase